MTRLGNIIEEDEPIESETWDDWYEYLDYHRDYIPKEEIIKLIHRFSLKGEKYLKNTIIKIWDNKHTMFLQYDAENGTADLIKDIVDWVIDFDDYELLDIGEDEIYNGHVDSTLKDLCQNPGKVYHYTTDEKWNEIRQDGKVVGSYGTGINNRGAYGIFTSVNPEEYADGVYGPICLEIDLESFKTDIGVAELNLRFEPEVEEYLLRQYLISKLDLDNEVSLENDGGISEYTVIVNHVIPIKYVREYGN